MYFFQFVYSQQMVLMLVVGAYPNTSIPNEENLTTIVTDVSDILWSNS